MGKTIIVSDIPDGISETKVLLYFQTKSNGGGEVEKIKLFSEYWTALVVFEEAQGKKLNIIERRKSLYYVSRQYTTSFIIAGLIEEGEKERGREEGEREEDLHLRLTLFH